MIDNLIFDPMKKFRLILEIYFKGYEFSIFRDFFRFFYEFFEFNWIYFELNSSNIYIYIYLIAS